MSQPIPYQQPSDDQTFNRRAFRVRWWQQILTDHQALAAERGRVAIHAANLAQEIRSDASRYLQVPFLGQITETYYRIQLAFEVADFGIQSEVGLDILTEDTSDGSHQSAAQTIQPISLRVDNPDPWAGLPDPAGRHPRVLPWPRVRIDDMPQTQLILSPWLTHVTDPDLELERTFRIYFQSTVDARQAWLSGICAVGYTDAAGGIL